MTEHGHRRWEYVRRMMEGTATASMPQLTRAQFDEAMAGTCEASGKARSVCECQECRGLREAGFATDGDGTDAAGTDGSSMEAGDGMDASAPFTESARTAVTSAGPKRFEVVIIQEGMGNSRDRRWYTREALVDAVQRGLFNGLQAYRDHPTAEEERERPERSIGDLIGHYSESRIVESGGKVEIRAIFTPINGEEGEKVAALFESALDANERGVRLLGISINGHAAMERSKGPDGRPAMKVIRMTEVQSADVVTKAAAGGRVVRRLVESLAGLRAQSHVTEDDMKKRLAQAIARLREADGAEAVDSALTELEAIADSAPDESGTGSTTEADRRAERAEARVTELEAELEAKNGKLSEAEGKLQAHERIETARGVLREAEVPEGLADWYEEQLRQLPTKEAMEAFVERQRAYEEKLIESVPMGAGPRQPQGNGKGTLAAAGIPMTEGD